MEKSKTTIDIFQSYLCMKINSLEVQKLRPDESRHHKHEVSSPSGEKFTAYEVDVDTLTEECDWKSYKRMELLPGDLINIEGIAVLKVVADLPGEESCDQCALTCVDSSTHRIGGEKEAALCMMCDCEGTRRSAPCVHLEV